MKIFKTLFVATFALVVSYSVYSTQQNAEMSDLALAKVEAFTNGELKFETVNMAPLNLVF